MDPSALNNVDSHSLHSSPHNHDPLAPGVRNEEARRVRVHRPARRCHHLDVYVLSSFFLYLPWLTGPIPIALAPAIAALVANVAVLILAGVVYANHRTRKLLWRQSLLMLFSCQVAGVFMDVAFMSVILHRRRMPEAILTKLDQQCGDPHHRTDSVV
jgi:hypothetical protein